MELTPREKEVLKIILKTDLSEADELIRAANNPKDVEELFEFYDIVRNIVNKL